MNNNQSHDNKGNAAGNGSAQHLFESSTRVGRPASLHDRPEPVVTYVTTDTPAAMVQVAACLGPAPTLHADAAPVVATVTTITANGMIPTPYHPQKVHIGPAQIVTTVTTITEPGLIQVAAVPGRTLALYTDLAPVVSTATIKTWPEMRRGRPSTLHTEPAPVVATSTNVTAAGMVQGTTRLGPAG
jgi:hypothetical protein